MKTVLKTAPAEYPVLLPDVKDHLRIVEDNEENDDYLISIISAATDKTEQFLRRRLISQTWYLYLDEWPSGDVINIPFGQLQSVTAIKYTNSAGTESTFAAADYIVDADSDPGRVVLGYGESWPTTTLYPSNPIEIEFVCGYGAAGTSVNVSIKHAIMLAISDLFENREPTFIGQGYTLTKTGAFERLLWPYRIHSI